MTRLSRSDMESLWSQLDKSQENFSRLVLIFQQQLIDLGRALAHMDLERLQIESHRIRSTAVALGASELQEILSEIERASSCRDVESIKEMRQRCEEEMVEVMAELDIFLVEKRAA